MPVHETVSRRAADAVVELLRSEGVDRVFGNPGTTELPLLDAFADSRVPFVLGLQEGSVVAMADGYARGRGQTAVAILHVAAGLANGLVGLLNASRSQVPIVVVAGQQDRRHLDQAPLLAGDLVGLAMPACKAAWEVAHGGDLPALVRRAFRLAAAPPAGPVLVSLPMDLLMEPFAGSLPPPSVVRHDSVAAGVSAAATLLAGAERPAIVAGDGIGRADAVAEAVTVAEAIDATVYLQPLYDRVNFPISHRLTCGTLPPSNAAIAQVLGQHDVVLLCGLHTFAPHYFTTRECIPSDVSVVQLDDDPAAIGRHHAVELGLAGGVRATLAQLARALSAQPTRGHSLGAAALAGVPPHHDTSLHDGEQLDPGGAVRAIAAGLDARTLLVDESITMSALVRSHLPRDEPGSFHHTIGGGLGWGIGAAVGLALARPRRSVAAVLGDGSALYGVQGLWTAAHLGVPVTFVILNNREYRAVRSGLDALGDDARAHGHHAGWRLSDPLVDWGALATGFGVRSLHPVAEDEVTDAIAAAQQAREPMLVEVSIAGSADREGSRAATDQDGDAVAHPR